MIKFGIRQSFLNVHLSAKECKQHLPIDNFCKEIVSYLIGSKWAGNVILEYLFEFHDQMPRDIEIFDALRRKLIGKGNTKQT